MRNFASLLTPIALLFASAANAQFCVDFDEFDDGTSVTIGVEGVISAAWENFDGTGGEAPMVGFTEAGGGANVLVCSDASCPFGNQYAFFIAYPVRSFWLYDLTNGTNVVADSPFSLSGGACPFGPAQEGKRKSRAASGNRADPWAMQRRPCMSFAVAVCAQRPRRDLG